MLAYERYFPLLLSFTSFEAIDGGWSAWSAWGSFSATCGTGLQSRNRTCSNTVREQLGRPCVGDFSDYQLCESTLCSAIDGGWSAWSAWGSCSATCGSGLQSRNRTCSNPAPELHGRPCVGDFSDHQFCVSTSCEGTGIWFYVYGPQNPPTKWQVKFAHIYYNYNNVYNITTGEFVCPKRGLYSFQSTLIRETAADTSNPQSYCWLYRDGSTVQYISIQSSYTNAQASGLAIVDLLPGERIYIGYCYNIAQFSHYSSFIGFLVTEG